MSDSFVVDCSVTMTWLFADEATPQTADLRDRLSGDTAIVPSMWSLELTNVLWLAERKGRITPADSAQFVADLSKLGIEVDKSLSERPFDYLLPLCRNHQLTSYDAAYLELAIQRGLPLATLDEPLRKAAKKLGVELLGK